MSRQLQLEEIMPRKWMSLRKVAELLDTSESTVRREIKAGRLRAYKIGKLIKIAREDFLDYERRCQVRPLKVI